MTDRQVMHETFVIERSFRAAPARVFHAFANRAAKAVWFSGPPEQWTETLREFDFRVGGHERLNGTWPGGRTSAFSAVYYDIVPNQRIVYSYDMLIDGTRISVSLATVELTPASAGTRLVITEQGVFLDGYDDAGSRERGTGSLLERLAASLEQSSS